MHPATNGSTQLSSARIRFALIALAVGAFGIGTTEFVAMGLLPDIARDLLPELFADSPEHANAQAGWLISAYALGVVVGAPTIAALVARYPRRYVLVALGAAFTVATVATSLAPTFETVLISRFVAGIPHGAYFGMAALVAAKLMGPSRRARGVALVMSGLTIANMVGVPLATFVGQSLGWRAAYFLVAAIFAVATAAVWFAVPQQPGDAAQTMRKELTAFTRVQVWYALLIGSIGFGGFFAVYSYVAPIVTDVAGSTPGLVPWVLFSIGLGMTLGNFAGGYFADKSVKLSLFLFFPLMLLMLVGLALTASWLPTLFFFVFAIGFAAQGISPTIQTRLMDVAGDSQSIAAALNHSALNIGNALGAFLGGVTIAAGAGYLSPVWVGVVLTLAGIVLTALSYGTEARTRGRAGGDSAAGDRARTDRSDESSGTSAVGAQEASAREPA